jgi:ribosomal protein L11 methyltransferase
MSFGTGHHETTHLIVAEQLSINHEKKHVLDVGTGTGVLAIMAAKLGTHRSIATDIDDWCIENSKENFTLNGLSNISILQGSIDKLTFDTRFDIIYANINKNVLLNELKYYAQLLEKDGFLVLSGFYSEDIPDLESAASHHQLSFDHSKTRNNWAMMVLSKQNA